MPEGFLVLDKPSGVTSHDMVSAVRKAVGIRKVGHAGTLDPMATGALVVAVGRSTRLLRFIQPLPKEYLARARFGVATDTLDADGERVWTGEMKITRSDVQKVIGDFVGEIKQVPPMVSALRVGGRRLYELAREGIEVERKARSVTVHSLVVTDFEEGPHPLVGLRVECGKGVYVRSLADDIAVRLGGRAHLVALRRTRVGSLEVGQTPGQALGVEDLTEWRSRLLTPAAGLGHLRAWVAEPPILTMVKNGRRLTVDQFPEEESTHPIRVMDSEGHLWAVYRRRGELLVPEVVLN